MLARISALAVVLSLAACDSTGIDLSYDEVEVSALRVEHLATIPTSEGRRVSFRYIGSIPSPCYESSGYGYGVSYDDDPRQLTIAVTMSGRRTAEVCAAVEGTFEVYPLDLTVPDPGSYVFAFERSGQSPLEITVDVE